MGISRLKKRLVARSLPLASPYAIGVRCPRAARSLVSMAEPTPDERIAALEKELQAAKLAALEQKLADAKKAMAELACSSVPISSSAWSM